VFKQGFDENVYLAEVELAVSAHPAVREAAVVAVPDRRWGEVGRAVIVLEPGGAATAEQLQEFLRGRLARYKIPKEFVFADQLPRSSYGKLIRSELRERFGRGPYEE
jgi:fatty-acyl-CoA synthase